MNAEVITLNKKIINCNKCSRLIEFRKKIVKKKRKQFIDQKYWGKPITGFGDINAKMLFVALHQLHMEPQEQVEFLQEINHQNFYINVCLKQTFQIFPPPSILMMV